LEYGLETGGRRDTTVALAVRAITDEVDHRIAFGNLVIEHRERTITQGQERLLDLNSYTRPIQRRPDGFPVRAKFVRDGGHEEMSGDAHLTASMSYIRGFYRDRSTPGISASEGNVPLIGMVAVSPHLASLIAEVVWLWYHHEPSSELHSDPWE
jgi:hypothetical protein